MPGYKLIVKNAKVILKTVTNAVLNITGIKDLLTGDGSVDSNNKINWTLQEYTNTATNFTSNNPILLLGQKGIETDDLLTAPKFKIGDGVTAWNTLPYAGGSSTTPTLQEVTDEGYTTTNPLIIDDGLGNGAVDIGQTYLNVLDSTALAQLLEVDRVNDTVKILGVDVATNGKGAAIASASTVDLGVDGNSLYHITGTTTITSFSNLPSGVKKTIVFDGSLIITASSDIILPGNISMVTGAGDNAIVIGEGSGVVRFLSFYKYDESYTNYTPSVTGYSVAPTVTAGDCRWKMLTKNTCHVIIWPTTTGTSNATTKTVTLPFTAAWTGGAGFGLQQATMGMYNNGAHVNGSVRTRAGGSNILDCYPSIIGSSWNSASTQANTYIDFVYQIEI